MEKPKYVIEYYSEQVEQDVLSLPDTLLARYFGLTDRMKIFGGNLGEPHTKAFGNGLFELRLKGPKASPVCFIARASAEKL